jgi:hypothetical protein
MSQGVIDPAALGPEPVRPRVVVVGDHDLTRLAAADQNVIKVCPASPDWHPMSLTTHDLNELRGPVVWPRIRPDSRTLRTI